MKAEHRKEIETNSIVLYIQKWRKHANWRSLYYVIGTVGLVVAGILLYRYFTGESRKTRDATLDQLAYANTPDKLKDGIEAHRGTVYGNIFKMQLARYMLKNEGLPKLGTDSKTSRDQARASVEQARTYYLDLTSELKEKEQAALVQEAWVGAAQAEEALVGLPTTDGGTDSRGEVDKAIKYYQQAGSIFPDTEFSKRYAARAEMLKNNKDQFVAAQKAFYKPLERPTFPPGLPPSPSGPKLGPPEGPMIPPPAGDPKSPAPKPADPPKIEVPPIPTPPVDPKKTDPKPSDPSKVDPKPKS